MSLHACLNWRLMPKNSSMLKEFDLEDKIGSFWIICEKNDYNELINYIVSIAKYNSLSQSLRVPIDERMNKLNGFLRNLIDVSYATKKYRLTSLEDMYDNIRNKIYKLVDIDINFTKFTADDAKKTELNSKLDLGIKIMRETANTFKKLNRKSTQEIDIQTWMKELKAFQKEQLILSNKKIFFI